MKKLWSSFNIAISMYSRLPAAQVDWNEDTMKYVMCFFPWIGIVIGALAFGWDKLAIYLGVGKALRNAVLVLVPIVVTGGIHLDGLLDTSDAMSSWRPMERRLEILKDSHAGAFAIITCCIYFLLAYGVLDMVEGELVLYYAFAFVISRCLSGFSVVTFKKASTKGTVAGFSKNAQTRIIQTTVIVYLVIVFAVLCILNPVFAVAELVGAGLTFLWYYRFAMKNFGGINGDLAGCFLSVCELVIPLCILIVNGIISRGWI